MLYVVSDHGGFALKQRLVVWLRQTGQAVTDLGPVRLHPKDDYPVAAQQLAHAVQSSPKNYGIAVCRTGVGMAIVANKHRGVRAVQAVTPAIAVRSRQDENTNILTIASDFQSWPNVRLTVQRWLTTSYRGEARQQRRLRQIKKIEHGR